MAFVKGMKAIAELKEKAEKEKASRSDRVKIDFFKLDDGESRRVRFLQEIDEDSPNYNPEMDVAVIMLEHQGPGPDGWKRRGQCTIDEGRCFPCEQRAAGNTDYRPAKSVMYLNVLEKPGTEEERVTVLSQAVFGNGIIQTLLEYAGDEEMGGSITDREWKVSRNGQGKDSKHTATAYPSKEWETPVTDYKDKMFDLTKAVVKPAYENQEAFYNSLGRKDGEEGRSEGRRKDAKDDMLGW